MTDQQERVRIRRKRKPQQEFIVLDRQKTRDGIPVIVIASDSDPWARVQAAVNRVARKAGKEKSRG